MEERSDINSFNETATLVDQVEGRLLEYFKENGLQPGSSVPGEVQLSRTLGVGRSVVREALSRLRMLGVIKSRTKSGIVVSEPDIIRVMNRMINPLLLGEDSILDLLGFRISMEIGMADFVINNATEADILELEQMVGEEIVDGRNEFSIDSDRSFHSKLYRMTGNTTFVRFQELLSPLFTFVRRNHYDYLKDYNSHLEDKEVVTHRMLLEKIELKDVSGFQHLMKQHLNIYNNLIYRKELHNH